MYSENRYLASYTSLLGPSGIGKSFAVAQVARQYGIYEVYSSLSQSLSQEGSLFYS